MQGNVLIEPEASIIIRTFNEEKHIQALLDALAIQSYSNFETILVDSGSLDRTREIAEGQVDTLLRIDSQDFTFGYSLNVGIQVAKGRFAVIVSAHTLPLNNRWLSGLLAPFSEDSIAMTYGRQLGGGESNFSELQDLRRTFGPKPKVLHPPHYFAHNGNSAIRIALWKEHNFDEQLPGLEDIEWARFWMDKGYKVAYDPDAGLHHNHKEHWTQIRRRYYRESVAARDMGIKSKIHIPHEIIKESGKTVLDVGRAVASSLVKSEYIKQSGYHGDLLERFKDVFAFRSNKCIGSVKGLLQNKSAQFSESRQDLFFDRTCQMVVAQEGGRATLEQRRLPDVKPGDVLIRTAYIGICGLDIQLFNGVLRHSRDAPGTFPIVPGHEVSGRVVQVGTNVKHIREGDPVVIASIQSCGACSNCEGGNWIGCVNRAELGISGRDGGFSQFCVMPGRYVHKLPQDLSLQKATLCEPLAIILKGLRRLSQFWPTYPESKRCGVIGGGSFGHLCAKVLHARGHNVTVFDQDPTRREYFNGSGIEVSDNLSSVFDFDVLIEVTGDPQILDTLLQESGPAVAILLLDLPYAEKHIFLEKFLSHDKSIISSSGSTPEDVNEAINLIALLDVDSMLECTYPLAEFRTALDMFKKRKFLKVMIEISGD